MKRLIFKRPIIATISCTVLVLFLLLLLLRESQQVSDYKPVAFWGGKGMDDGQFLYIEDMALDSKGHLLIADALRSDVQVFDKKGNYIGKFPKGKGEAKEKAALAKPVGIIVDDEGNIYVTDFTLGVIKKFDKEYRYIATFGQRKKYRNTSNQFKFGCFNPVNHLLYIPEMSRNRLMVFNKKGELQFSFGSFGVGSGKFNLPEASGCASDGTVYVVDVKNHKVQVFNAKGQFLHQWGMRGSKPGQFEKPRGLAIDNKGNVFISEVGNARIQKFTRDGKFITQWGHEGQKLGQFGNLHGLVIDNFGDVYVGDTANYRIQKFTSVRKQ